MKSNKEIPKYFQERPELLRLGEEVTLRVYDRLIDRYYDAYTGKGDLFLVEFVKEQIADLDNIQLEKIKSLTRTIIFDTLINTLGIFEADPQFILTFQRDMDKIIDVKEITNGEMVDILSISDGFTSDMLGEEGWFDLFSKYGDGNEYLG